MRFIQTSTSAHVQDQSSVRRSGCHCLGLARCAVRRGYHGFGEIKAGNPKLCDFERAAHGPAETTGFGLLKTLHPSNLAIPSRILHLRNLSRNSLAKLGFIIVEAEVFSHLRLAASGVGVSGWKERGSDWRRSGGIGS